MSIISANDLKRLLTSCFSANCPTLMKPQKSYFHCPRLTAVQQNAHSVTSFHHMYTYNGSIYSPALKESTHIQYKTDLQGGSLTDLKPWGSRTAKDHALLHLHQLKSYRLLSQACILHSSSLIATGCIYTHTYIPSHPLQTRDNIYKRKDHD